MEPAIKKLRQYQERLVTDVCRANEDVLVEQPTGSDCALFVTNDAGYRGIGAIPAVFLDDILKP